MHIRIKGNLSQFIKFGCVGLFGAFINLSIYYVLVRFAHTSVNVSSVLAFLIAVTNNYVINHMWTFGVENENKTINLQQYVYYFMGNIVGLMCNLAVLNWVILSIGQEAYLVGQGVGIFCGMTFNFAIAKKLVFLKQVSKTEQQPLP